MADVPHGWNLDADGWLWRNSRSTDPQISQRSDIGFDDSTFPSQPKRGQVHVRSAEYARAIDAGRMPEPANKSLWRKP